MNRLQGDGAGRDRSRGSAMLVTIVALVVLLGLVGAVMGLGMSAQKEHRAAEEGLKARYLADAGISNSIASMIAGGNGALGSAGAPVAFSDGSYWVQSEVIDPVNDISRLTAHGAVNSSPAAIEAVVRPVVQQVYQNAIYAGNSSGDPNYVMEFGGNGNRGDRITGDIYSGGGISVTQNAQINGVVRATGAITGTSGYSGITQPVPDFAAMDYPTNNDFDVAQLFSTATYAASAYGGSAWQMPEASPVHIFRKNPTDRASFTNATQGDDFFLEDPYEALHLDLNSNGSDASMLSLSGVGTNPGPYSNHTVFYVEGNLWVFNLLTNSFKFKQPQNDPNAFTIVVKGNIYIADNLFYLNQNKDGFALIALKDPSVPDSGNIYLGDPSDGTLKQVDSFLYAENNFYDNNLDEHGSRDVTINGNMTAGDQVDIERDYGHQHSKLIVNYDGRLVSGSLNLPGIPSMTGVITAYTVLSWRQVALK